MNLFDDFISLFFPKTCFACGNNLFTNEKIICTSCLVRLPRTNFHKDNNNPLSRVFWGRVKVESSASLFYFRKGGRVQHLVHQLKYKGHREIGVFLGELLGSDLTGSNGFDSVEKIIPIPLHEKKLRKRGFNQSEVFAQGLASAMKKELDTTSVVRTIATSTQTKKSRYKRWENVNEIFVLRKPETLSGKHILLVDDVVTTGATMEACIQTILLAPGSKVSVASIAFAHH
ncbi:MAG: ComF family protein [Bacteroidetes bacterium]|nr:ComF family protein [Bacteroidota bacterium]